MLSVMGFLVLSACSQPKQVTGDIANLEPSQNILGGQPVEASDPVAASTVAIVSLSHGSVICTGSLITGNIVMTAAHCTTKDLQPLAILFSRRNWKNEDDVKADIAAKLLLQVDSGAVNSLFGKVQKGQKDNWGDIAVLRFKGALPAGYAPAKLLNNRAALQNGMTVTLAGYGLIDGARKTDTDSLRKVDLPLTNATFSKTEVMFDQSAGKGGCHGDSGGPAFVRLNGKLLLFGITSRGVSENGMDDCLSASIYTDAAAYTDWLKSAVAKLNQATTTQAIR